MLQDIPTQALREASPCVLETERLSLRRPTLADVKAIAHLANDRRIAENTRRLPHPYLQDHAVEFVRATSTDNSETVFLIEQNYSPIGMVGRPSLCITSMEKVSASCSASRECDDVTTVREAKIRALEPVMSPNNNPIRNDVPPLRINPRMLSRCWR